MALLGFFLVFCWFVRGFVFADDTCFNSTTPLFDFLATTADGAQDITVVLCPKTTFDVGDLGDTGADNGQMPLIAFPRTTYLCGEDGASTNNCVLRGGEIQFWNPPGAAIGEISVRGVTFENSTFVAILLQGSGTIDFIDCIIQVSTERGTWHTRRCRERCVTLDFSRISIFN